MLDKSGSMSGIYMENTKKVTRLMIEYIKANFKNCKIMLGLFDTEVKVYDQLEGYSD